jgi:hypothetical protein
MIAGSHSFSRSTLPRLRNAQTGDKNNYSTVDMRAYLIPNHADDRVDISFAQGLQWVLNLAF